MRSVQTQSQVTEDTKHIPHPQDRLTVQRAGIAEKRGEENIGRGRSLS